MIPILYESNETQFQSNGIGRLTDCITCKVTEERNGIYELEFEYPVDGHRYEDIVEGRIIAVKHDDTDDIQPFDIYGHSAPIDGIVTFYAHHISYRLGEITVKPFSASSCTETFEKLKINSLYGNPFSFWTDKSVNVEFEMDTPFNLKEYLGGTEGSILDVFGTGEYEFDKWLVKFHLNRGTDTNVQIRYGKNLADLQDDEDWSGCYTSVVPYWFGQDQETDEDILVTLDNWILSSGQSTYGGREIIVPMDLSSEWQDPPTKAQLQQTATQRLMLGEGWMPSKSVKVDFVHLWQTEEYKEYAPLQRVKLCDTVTVIYPKLGMEFTKKVVSVKYDALLERYDEITLGESTTSFGNLISTETAKQVANAKLYLRKIIKNTNYALQQNMEDEIQHVTDLITGGQGGYAVWGFNANGYPEELFFLDQPSVETAVNVLRINKNGIGFSTTGVNGTYTTAWTIDGHFVADFITSGVLTANVIRSGLLSDVVGNNYWNLDTGEFQLSWTGTKVGDDSLGTTVNKATRSILNHANAYGLGWKVNASTFTNENNGECYYHGYSEDGTAADINGWVYWNGQQITIPKGCTVNPNSTMPFDAVIYSVFRTSDNTFHDVTWTGTQWEGNTYSGSSPSARAVWTWNEATDIILASYLLAASESAIYGAQLFTPPKKYSELAEKAESALYNEIHTFATQVTEQIEDIQEQLDGVVDTYYYSYKPTLANEPASEWTTDADRTNHIGDMFYDTSTGKVYRWVSDNTNLISYPYYHTTRTNNGITWTDNGDGTVTANGTATANSEFIVVSRKQEVLLEQGIYNITGCPSGGSTSTYCLWLAQNTVPSGSGSWFNNGYDVGNGRIFTITDTEHPIHITLNVRNGNTVSNLVFNPKLTLKYGWKEIPDTEAQQALQLASEAKDTADHKRRVFITTPYVPYDQGDIWMQGANGDIMVCLEGKTATEAYSQTDWGKLNKYTDEATALAIAEEQVNSIEIGGRNLLADTNSPMTDSIDGLGTKYFANTASLITDTNGTAEWVEIPDSPVAGIKYGAKCVCTTTGGANHSVAFYTGINAVITKSNKVAFKQGQVYTASVWAKSNVVGAELRYELTGSNPTGSTTGQTISTADTWERHVWTFTFENADTQDTIFYLGFQYNVVATVYMCGFQLEVGNVATDWSEHPRIINTYSGRNLIRNTNNVDLTSNATQPNINGYYNDGNHYGDIITNSHGTTISAEHGVRNTVTSAVCPYVCFGTTSTTASEAHKNGTFGLEKGVDYTWSFDYECKLFSGTISSATSSLYFTMLVYYYNGSSWSLLGGKYIRTYLANERGTVKSGRTAFTFNIPENVDDIYLVVRGNNTTETYYASGDYIELRNMKLEKGNKATDWSAAPEDIAGDIVDVYVKSGGRNYLTGTGTPSIFSSDGYSDSATITNYSAYATYNGQTLEEYGFTTKDKMTLSFDWKYEANNLLSYPYYHTTRSGDGITFTDNGDGTVTANGTATANVSFTLAGRTATTGTMLFLKKGTYKLSGCPSGGSSSMYRIWINHTVDGSGVTYGNDFGDGLTFTVTEDDTQVGIGLGVYSGATVSDLVFNPKIVRVDADADVRMRAYGKTDSADYGTIANIVQYADLPVAGETNSGHFEKTLDVTSALLGMKAVTVDSRYHMGTLTISNMKLEKGETASSWTVAPEDAGIISGGANMLRKTNVAVSLGGTDGWSNGEWNTGGNGTGTRTNVTVDGVGVEKIKHGWDVTSEEYKPLINNDVLVCQRFIPHVDVGRTYTISCYAKGRGYLLLCVGITNWVTARIYIDHPDKWQKYSRTFIMPEHGAFINRTTKVTYAYFGTTGALSSVTVCGMKLEEGLSATEWSYADEDVIDEISDLEEDLKTQIDGKIETFYQSADPSTAWTTTALKTEHTGDLWYKTSDHSTWRWTGTAWQEQMASDAVFDKIDGKTTVFYGTTSGSYTGVEVGDYLVDSTDGSTYKRTSSGWTKVTDYKSAVDALDTSLNQQSVFNRLTNNGQTQGIYLSGGKVYINASYIQTGSLLASLITSGKIQSNNGKVYFDLDNNVLCSDRIVSTDTSSQIMLTIGSGKQYSWNDSSYYSLRGAVIQQTGVRPSIALIPGASDTGINYIRTGKEGLCIGVSSKQNPATYNGDSGFLGIVGIDGQLRLYGAQIGGVDRALTNNTSPWGGVFIHSRWKQTSSSSATSDGTIEFFGPIKAGQINAGSLQVSGLKNRVVSTKNYGDRLLYCYETTSPMFGDIGEGVIGDDGKCYIWLDPVMSETITTDGYQVFLQKYGDGDCYISERTSSYFVVSGTSGMSFGWELKAKQSDFDQRRMEKQVEQDYAVDIDSGDLAISYIQELKEGRIPQ